MEDKFEKESDELRSKNMELKSENRELKEDLEMTKSKVGEGVFRHIHSLTGLFSEYFKNASDWYIDEIQNRCKAFLSWRCPCKRSERKGIFILSKLVREDLEKMSEKRKEKT